MRCLWIVVALLLIASCAESCYPAEMINLERIKQIESNGNPLAYNNRSHAVGLYQITPICLTEYNNFHKVKYSQAQLFNGKINRKIAEWYINIRIPSMLSYYHKPITVENVLISYNAGISYVVKGKPLPIETVNYIRKYQAQIDR